MGAGPAGPDIPGRVPASGLEQFVERAEVTERCPSPGGPFGTFIAAPASHLATRVGSAGGSRQSSITAGRCATTATSRGEGRFDPGHFLTSKLAHSGQVRRGHSSPGPRGAKGTSWLPLGWVGFRVAQFFVAQFDNARTVFRTSCWVSTNGIPDIACTFHEIFHLVHDAIRSSRKKVLVMD